MDLPKLPIFADIPTAARPTPGQGLALDARGKIPASLLPSTGPTFPSITYQSGTHSGTWNGFTTMVTLTIPKAGDYTIVASASGSGAGQGATGFQLVVNGSTVYTDTTSQNGWSGWCRQYKFTGATAGQTVVLQVNNTNVVSYSYSGEITATQVA